MTAVRGCMCLFVMKQINLIKSFCYNYVIFHTMKMIDDMRSMITDGQSMINVMRSMINDRLVREKAELLVDCKVCYIVKTRLDVIYWIYCMPVFLILVRNEALYIILFVSQTCIFLFFLSTIMHLTSGWSRPSIDACFQVQMSERHNIIIRTIDAVSIDFALVCVRLHEQSIR